MSIPREENLKIPLALKMFQKLYYVIFPVRLLGKDIAFGSVGGKQQ
jgi:hypothetical protein